MAWALRLRQTLSMERPSRINMLVRTAPDKCHKRDSGVCQLGAVRPPLRTVGPIPKGIGDLPGNELVFDPVSCEVLRERDCAPVVYKPSSSRNAEHNYGYGCRKQTAKMVGGWCVGRIVPFPNLGRLIRLSSIAATKGYCKTPLQVLHNTLSK